MNTPTQPYGRYEADPTPYLAFMAIAGGLFVSAPAVVGGIALARVARRAMGVFIALAAVGLLWTLRSWDRIAHEMHRAQLAGQRHGMLTHASESWHAAWPHIRAWWLLAAPLGSCSRSGSPPSAAARSRNSASATSAEPTVSADARNAEPGAASVYAKRRPAANVRSNLGARSAATKCCRWSGDACGCRLRGSAERCW